MTLSPPSLTSHAIFEQYLCSTSHLGTFKYVSVHVGVQIRASWSCFFLLFGPDVVLLWMNVFLLLLSDGGVFKGQPNHNALNYLAL